jgi:acyl-[acyl-carrier-protein]-phospholipid O-acyltransferase/long-chain-fatty-acid--[acyl-carrier-protein] ligase
MSGQERIQNQDNPEGGLLPEEQRGGGALAALLLVQMMNSFSDNLVKMLLIVFAGAVAGTTPERHGSFLGDKMQACVGVVFSLPYIFLAPLAGWLSDHFSKQRVVFWMQVSQIFIFLFFAFAISLRMPGASLVLGLVGMLFLATESAIFAPAKLGILKELAGSSHLGLVSGIQQFTMFGAILFSYWLAGDWFGARLKTGADPWHSALILLWVVVGLATLQSLGSLLVRRTPAHPEIHWRRELMSEHFVNLRLVFKFRAIGIAALGVVFFWFMCNAVGAILVGFCNEQYPDIAEAAQMKGRLSAMLGIGVMSGILTATLMSRRRIAVSLVPVAGALIGLAMFWIWLMPYHSKQIYPAMVLSGFGAGAFMVPLYAFIQDRSREHERASILAGVGLIDCLGSAAANLIVMLLLIAKVPSVLQLVGIGVLSLVTAAGMLKLVARQHERHEE